MGKLHRVFHGDCIEVLRATEPESVDAVVTDPPYHLTNVAYDFRKTGSGNARQPAQIRSTGFMNQKWDGGDIAFRPETWAEIYRVMKPGAHLVSFGGTRTYHRMVCAIEDAGFEIRDQLAWLYGSGFPKSHDVSKAIDRAAGAEGAAIGYRPDGQSYGDWDGTGLAPITAPATEAAKQWFGWGTALKPSHEPIVLARKPLAEPTVAAQVLATGTGALNIDASRVATDEVLGRFNNEKPVEHRVNYSHPNAKPLGRLQQMACLIDNSAGKGRWPANLVHSGEPEVLDAFARFGEKSSGNLIIKSTMSGWRDNESKRQWNGVSGDTGTAARFFASCPWSEDELRFHYCGKATKKERLQSKHPTVKPLGLMKWLVRLITPPGGTVLDPFAGSGTTLAACGQLGFNSIGIEMDWQYVKDIEAKLRHFCPKDEIVIVNQETEPPITDEAAWLEWALSA